MWIEYFHSVDIVPYQVSYERGGDRAHPRKHGRDPNQGVPHYSGVNLGAPDVENRDANTDADLTQLIQTNKQPVSSFLIICQRKSRQPKPVNRNQAE